MAFWMTAAGDRAGLFEPIVKNESAVAPRKMIQMRNPPLSNPTLTDADVADLLHRHGSVTLQQRV